MRFAISIWCVVAAAASARSEPPPPSDGVTRLTIEFSHTTLRGTRKLTYDVVRKNKTLATKDVRVDPKLIDAIYAALTKLTPTDESPRCIAHTDDYPGFQIVIAGNRPLEISASSNCRGYVPWVVRMSNKQFVQFDGSVGRAIHALLEAIDPAAWNGVWRARDIPTGAQVVVFKTWHGGSEDSLAARCAKAFGADRKISQALGFTPAVVDLRLTCNLDDSPACDRLAASAVFPWDGIDAQLSLPCDGTNLVLGDLAPLAKLRRVVASKPVRALVAISKSRPVVQRVGNRWQIDTADLDLPQLASDGELVTARSVADRVSGERFWTALGHDARRLAKKHDGSVETAAKLDLEGRIVR